MIEVASAEEAIEVANNTNYGLAGSVFSSNMRKAMRLARQMRAGTVTVNSYGEGDITTPFGGYRESGFGGRDNSLAAHDQYTEMKTIWIDPATMNLMKFRPKKILIKDHLMTSRHLLQSFRVIPGLLLGTKFLRRVRSLLSLRPISAVTGLSSVLGLQGYPAARRLAKLRGGDKIAVIDATTIGDGPAGRNSGFMIDLPHELSSEEYTSAMTVISGKSGKP